VQPFGSERKTACLGDRQKIAQMAQLHRYPCLWGMRMDLQSLFAEDTASINIPVTASFLNRLGYAAGGCEHEYMLL
jgi:hypothetical protein